jgi:hypothetical protein
VLDMGQYATPAPTPAAAGAAAGAATGDRKPPAPAGPPKLAGAQTAGFVSCLFSCFVCLFAWFVIDLCDYFCEYLGLDIKCHSFVFSAVSTLFAVRHVGACQPEAYRLGPPRQRPQPPAAAAAPPPRTQPQHTRASRTLGRPAAAAAAVVDDTTVPARQYASCCLGLGSSSSSRWDRHVAGVSGLQRGRQRRPAAAVESRQPCRRQGWGPVEP